MHNHDVSYISIANFEYLVVVRYLANQMRDTGACKSRMHRSSYGNRWSGNDRIDP